MTQVFKRDRLTPGPFLSARCNSHRSGIVPRIVEIEDGSQV
jgi:hypothetical protein